MDRYNLGKRVGTHRLWHDPQDLQQLIKNFILQVNDIAAKFNVDKSKDIINMDEVAFRATPAARATIVPRGSKEVRVLFGK